MSIENKLLGYLISSPAEWVNAVDIISAYHFDNKKNELIFERAVELIAKGKPADLMVLSKELPEQTAYLFELVKGTSSLDVDTYCLMVKEAWLERSAKTKALELHNSTEDIDDALTKFEKEIDVMRSEFTSSQIQPFASLIVDSVKSYEQREVNRKEGKRTGIATGLNDLDRMTGGWQKSHLIILAGRPGMGKTAFAVDFAKTAAKDDKNVLLFSIEMNKEQLIDRIVTGELDFDSTKYRDGYLSDEEKNRLFNYPPQLERMAILIDDTPSVRMKHIKTVSRQAARKGLDMIIIDYLQLVNMNSSNKSYNREQEVSEVSRQCKQLARELNVPIILLSQLSRACEQRGGDKKPMLSDLRESGSIEQDADIVLFAYRPKYYEITQTEDGTSTDNYAEILCRKNRHGSTGDVKLWVNDALTRVKNFGYSEQTQPLGNDDLQPSSDFDDEIPF